MRLAYFFALTMLIESLAGGSAAARQAGSEPPFVPNPFAHRFDGAEKPDPHSRSEIAALFARGFSAGEIAVPEAGDKLGLAAPTFPVYESGASDPLFTIGCHEYANCPADGKQIHIPAGALPQDGFDRHGEGHMVVIDTALGIEGGFYHVGAIVPNAPGTLTVGYGGTCAWNSYATAAGCNEPGTAGAMPMGALLVRPDEFLAGIEAKSDLGHAIYITTCASTTYHVYPAQNTNGTNAACPPLGAFIKLDLSDAAIAALPLPEWARVLLRTAAHYGYVVGDNNIGATTPFSFGFEDDNDRSSLGKAPAWSPVVALMKRDADKYAVDMTVSHGSYHAFVPNVTGLGPSNYSVVFASER